VAAENLKRLPFDYYGRYRLAAEAVHAMTRPGSTVLDVGGGPGALQAFLDDRWTVACDLRVETDQRVAASTLVLADGALLPFADDSFDVVVSLDTLEHVSPDARGAVLREATRVARSWVLIVAPCATDGVADADSALLSYLRNRFGEDYASVEVLTEHLAFGHPDPAEVLDRLGESGGQVRAFPSGRLDRWMPMMLLFYELMALGRDDPVERVQAWYNPRYWRDDLRAPAYRQAFLSRQPGADGPSLDDVVHALLPTADEPGRDAAAFEALRVALEEPLLDQVRTLTGRVRELERALAGAERGRQEQDSRIQAAEGQVAALLAFRDRVLSHPAVRIRGALRRRRSR
jgi:hypothetical protein